MFDLVIIGGSIVELTLDLLLLLGFANDSTMFKVGNVRLLRIIRITRFVRILRIPRLIRFITALNRLVCSIVATLKSLTWATLLMTGIVYMFAIIFTQSTTAYLDVAENADDLEVILYWGTLPDSMFTLFKSISGGISWHEATQAIGRVGSFEVALFVAFVYLAYFAVLNAVTGVFCQSAIESAQRDPSLVASSLMLDKKMYTQKMKELFGKMDVDGSGAITVDELEGLLSDENLLALFEAMGLEITDAWTLFKLIDADVSHAVDLQEFIQGCITLKGTARSTDLAELKAENRWMMQRHLTFFQYVEQCFDDMGCGIDNSFHKRGSSRCNTVIPPKAAAATPKALDPTEYTSEASNIPP